MADISTELQAILDAVFGEQVRGSIHDAIEKINEASEVVLSTGNLITYSGSSSQGFYVGSLYLNTDTYTLWKCIGTNSWQSLGVLKGRDGSQGVEGKTGPRGISVREVIPVGEGGFIIRLDDGTDSQTLYAPRGPQGERGLQGAPGTPGRGISNFETSKSGKVTSVTAVYTDGTKQLIANVMDGADGSGAGDMTYATYDPTQSGIVNSARELDNGTEAVTIENIMGKADKATTLEGYGIEDAYNAYETQQAISMAVSELNSEAVGGEGLYISSVEEVEGVLRATAKPFPQISGSWDGINGKPFEELGEGLSVDDDNVLSVTNNKSILSEDYYKPRKYYSKGDLCIYENEIYEQYGYNGVLIDNPPTQTAYWRRRSLSEVCKHPSFEYIGEVTGQTKLNFDVTKYSEIVVEPYNTARNRRYSIFIVPYGLSATSDKAYRFGYDGDTATATNHGMFIIGVRTNYIYLIAFNDGNGEDYTATSKLLVFGKLK